jgi:hypothetical protein
MLGSGGVPPPLPNMEMLAVPPARGLGQNQRLMTIALHPYAIGVPHLERALQMLKARDDTGFMTGPAIADGFVMADRAAR